MKVGNRWSSDIAAEHSMGVAPNGAAGFIMGSSLGGGGGSWGLLELIKM
ncbi:hypothetical protein PC129_g25376 [Phytophthora cactorum]|uniref:Uncharacterized protein n=1 Tax=Phytophthora cactorum TaxID=29920 RepID=A0A8T1GSA7_9STRA|nr:hypothetical protein PC129_g25376 [Phytophthora cactorum]